MSASRISLLIALSLAAAAPCAGAFAADGDEVVVAAAHTTKMPTEAEQAKAKADATALAQSTAKPTVAPAQTIAWLNNAPRVDRPDSDDQAAPLRGNGEKTGGRTIHGSAGVSIGTGGYRSGYVSTEIPIGETGTLGVAYSQTDYGKNGWLAAGPYGYSPYGYGPHGYGYGYGRGGRSQSVAVSLDMTGDRDGGPDTPDGCAPGFRYRGQYMEPLWVTHAQADQPCELQSDR